VTARARRRLLVPLLVLAASCTSGAKLAAAKFAGPSALAAFRGFSSKHPDGEGPRPYLAVANLLRDELTVVDPLDNELVPSATLAFPLAVPTRPRPFRLAAAPLEADGDPNRGADLLVVATQSPPSLQLVTTWTEQLKAVDLPVDDDLARVYPGEAVLSLAAATRPGGGAWVLVGLSGGHLAVLEFERDASSTLPAARRPVRRSALPLQQKELVTGAGRVDPLDLALLRDASRLFVATTDPLQSGGGATVFGVGQLTLTGSASDAWPVVGLDARAPTRLVAAATLAQRTLASAVVFESTASLQVFAVLDEAGCGPRAPISCGLVTLIPDVGIAPDPAGELPYRAPISFVSPITAMAVVMPRPGSDGGTPVGISSTTPIDHLFAGAGAALGYAQTALLVAATAGGNLFAVDPGRWGPTNVALTAEATHRALVGSLTSTATNAQDPTLGLWSDVSSPGGAATVVSSTSLMAAEIGFTPGYLPDQLFRVAWQGALPGLSSKLGILQWDLGQAVVAMQNAGAVAVHVADPELAVHVGDLVRVLPGAGSCADGVGFVATVRAIRAADPSFPGGALALSHAGGGAADPEDKACATPVDLVGDTSPGPVTATLTVLAAGLVLTGSELGYLGRPQVDVAFELRYQAEAGLAGEALAVARKLRRRFYPADAPCGATIPGTDPAVVVQCESSSATPPIYPPDGPDPLTPGPTLRFRVGLVGCPAGPNPCRPGAGAILGINTRSGLQAASWSSGVSQAPVTALAWLDARAVDPARTYTVYGSLATNEVLVVDPTTKAATSIR